MKLGFVGIGRTGSKLIERLTAANYEVIGLDLVQHPDTPSQHLDITQIHSVDELIQALPSQKIILIYLPDRTVAHTIEQLTPSMSPGDIIIDMSDSLYRNSKHHHHELKKQGIGFLDIGLVQDAVEENQATHFAGSVGGEQETYTICKPIINAIMEQDGVYYHPEPGAGHYIKMVQSGIEYGMMQAIAEGFSVLHQNGHYDLELDKLAAYYGKHGTTSSRLILGLYGGFNKFGSALEQLRGKIAHSRYGDRLVHRAHEFNISVPVIEEAVKQRKNSQLEPSYTSKVISLLRYVIGRKNATKKTD